MKISDHHVRSPLLNISQSCQVCHRLAESEQKARVETIQDKTKALQDRAEDSLVALITEIEKAIETKNFHRCLSFSNILPIMILVLSAL